MAAPTVQPTVPGTISVVTIILILTETPEQQEAAIDAIITYLLAFLQAIADLNVTVTSYIDMGRRQLASLRDPLRVLQQARYCSPNTPQDKTSIDLWGYENAAEVQEILNGIMNGTIPLSSLDESGSPTKVENTICYAEAKASLVPPTAPLNDDSNKTVTSAVAPGFISLIVLAGVAVLMIGTILFLRRRRVASDPPHGSAVINVSP